MEFPFSSKNSSYAKDLREVKDLAVDLGTATGIVYSDGDFGKIQIRDLRTQEQKEIRHIPTLVARKRRTSAEELSWLARREKFSREADQASGKVSRDTDHHESDVEAVGYTAFESWGRNPNWEFFPAVRAGNVADIKTYRSCMRHLLKTRIKEFKWSFEEFRNRPRLLIGVPHNATSHHLGIVESVIQDDLKAIPIPVWEQVAAAVGIRLPGGGRIPFQQAVSSAIADGGGGTFDFATLNNGRVVHMQSHGTAGDDLNHAIVAYLGTTHNIDVGLRTAIAIKETIGSAVEGTEEEETEEHFIKGSSFETQLPGRAVITRKLLREECLLPVLERIAEDFKRYLHCLHPYGEVHSDILDNGFYLTGGTSLLKGLDKYLEERTGLRMQRVENPMTSVIDGLIEMLDNNELLEMGRASGT